MKLSQQQRQIIDLTLQGMATQAIADRVGVCRNRVVNIRRESYAVLGAVNYWHMKRIINGEPKRRGNRQIDVYLNYRKQGLTYKQIAALENRSWQYIKKRVGQHLRKQNEPN